MEPVKRVRNIAVVVLVDWGKAHKVENKRLGDRRSGANSYNGIDARRIRSILLE